MFTRTQMFNFQQRADYFSPHIWIVCTHFWVQFASFFGYKLLEGGQLSASPLMIKVRLIYLRSRQRCKVSDLKRNLFLFMVELSGAGFSDNLEHSLFLVVSSLPGRLLRSWRQSLKWSSMSGPGPGCRVGVLNFDINKILHRSRSTHYLGKVSGSHNDHYQYHTFRIYILRYYYTIKGVFTCYFELKMHDTPQGYLSWSRR